MSKLPAVLKRLIEDNRNLEAAVNRLQKIKPVALNGKDGRDGKDGVSPSVEEITNKVISRIPEPEKVDTQEIIDCVLAKIPKPRDGRDAQQVNVSDVAAIVLAKIPKPQDGKDGSNGPSLETVVKNVRSQVKDGSPGPMGPPGPPGKDGVSVTDVQLTNNELFVSLDGRKKKVGKISVPTVSAPFRPGGGGGSIRAAVTVSKDPAIYVSSQKDFPTQTESEIVLSDNEVYVLSGSFEVTKPFVVGDGVLLDGRNTDAYTLTYNGSGTLFSGGNSNFLIRSITIEAPNAKIFDFQPTTPLTKRVFIREVSINVCDSFGDFGDLQILEISNAGSASAKNGIKLLGPNILTLSVNRLALFSAGASGFVGFDLGSTVITNILELNNVLFFGSLDEIGLSGLANSGNLPTGRRAMVAGCEFLVPTPLAGVTHSDVRWDFLNNTPVPDSRNAADTYLENGSETVIISTIGVYEEIGAPVGAANWASDLGSRFSVGNDGVITYIGEKDLEVTITSTLSIEKVGGGSSELECRLAKNWVAGQTGIYKSRAITRNTQPTSVSLGALISLQQNDTIRIILTNNTTTDDIIVLVAALNITEA